MKTRIDSIIALPQMTAYWSLRSICEQQNRHIIGVIEDLRETKRSTFANRYEPVGDSDIESEKEDAKIEQILSSYQQLDHFFTQTGYGRNDLNEMFKRTYRVHLGNYEEEEFSCNIDASVLYAQAYINDPKDYPRLRLPVFHTNVVAYFMSMPYNIEINGKKQEHLRYLLCDLQVSEKI